MHWKKRLLTDIRIDRLGYGWVGISKLPNGKTLMIKWWLPGSIVDCMIVKQKKDYIEAHIVGVKSLDSSLATQLPRCPHYHFHYQHHAQSQHDQQEHELGSAYFPEHKRGCGWCKWQVVSYEQQLTLKYQIVQDCFRKLADKMGGVEILPVVHSPRQFGYRNKIEFSFGKYLRKGQAEEWREVDEQWLLWFHKQGMYTKVVDVDQCYLIDDAMHQVYAFLKNTLQQSGLPVYDSKQHRWFLRHMVVRAWLHTGHTMVMLSIATAHLVDHPQDADRRAALQEEWLKNDRLQGHVTTLLINENNGLADVVKPEDVVLSALWGPWHIYEELRFGRDEGDEGVMSTLRFRISPFSFFQTNTLWAQELFAKAVQMMWHTTGTLVDLYCGSGTIGLVCLALGKWTRVKGIEVVDDAVKDAYYNAKINGLEERAEFYSGKAEDLLKQWVIDNDFFVWGDVVIVDPPREWLHKHVIDFLLEVHKRYACKVLYISCNPVTLARDIGLLLDGGMRCGPLQPVDMFPHTHHIEVVTILQ
jgi:23S rRNA (uracil1939-C5)-methyltransferase